MASGLEKIRELFRIVACSVDFVSYLSFRLDGEDEN